MTAAVFPPFDGDIETINNTLSHGFHLLQVERRRQVIWYVTTCGLTNSIPVRELAKVITAAEQDTATAQVTNENYRATYTNLAQHHLPTLADAHAVTYNEDRRTVTAGPNTRALAVLMATAIPTLDLLLAEEFE